MENETPEIQDDEIVIGTEESEVLGPSMVTIEAEKVEMVGKNNNKKAVLICKHPNRELPIEISSVKYEGKGGKLKITGLWLNLDNQGKLKKDSALATLLKSSGVINLKLMVGRQVETVLDEEGYLCFKAY